MVPRARRPPFHLLLLAAPPIFIIHFLEEGPRFVTWFNAHVARGITEPLFWQVNYTGLGITIAVVAMEWLSRSMVSAIAAVAWLSCLMFANALFHIAAAVVDGGYVPGLVSAVLLYLPFYGVVIAHVLRSRRAPVAAVVIAAMVGGLPMAIHGYRIVFLGTRLF